MMPGYVYPPGSESEDGLVRETVFDSTHYLRGLDGDVEKPSADEGAPVVLFLAGGPLSGKTTVFESMRDDGHDLIPENAVVVDPKALREQLPEWEPLHRRVEPAAAELLYEECCDIATRLVREAMLVGANLVIDGPPLREIVGFPSCSGSWRHRLRGVRAPARSPTETAQLRNLRRAESEGLLIDREVLAPMHRAVSGDFHDWKDFRRDGRCTGRSSAGRGQAADGGVLA